MSLFDLFDPLRVNLTLNLFMMKYLKYFGLEGNKIDTKHFVGILQKYL